MKKPVKIALIVLAIVAVLFGALTWFFLWSTRFSGDLTWKSDRIPPPAKVAAPFDHSGQGWPAWQGPTYNDRAAITGMKTDWSRGLPKAWEIRYLCKGPKSMSWACPAVQGNRLVVPGRDETDDILFCLDPDTGKLLWVKRYPLRTDDKYGQGQRATPTLDGAFVYSISREGDLRCHALQDGALVWEQNIKSAGGVPPDWGCAGSPLIHEGRVILHAGGGAIALAYDKATGALLWKAAPAPGCYTTPVLMPVGGRNLVVLFHQKAISFLDPASGASIHEIPLGEDGTDMTVATPALGGGLAFFSTVKGYGGMMVDTASGKPEMIWKSKAVKVYQANPIFVDGCLYTYTGMPLQNGGSFVCVEAASGRVLWKTDRIGHGTTIWADGHLVCLDIRGNLFLVKPDPGAFRLVGEFRGAVPGAEKRTWTKPIIARDKLYLRHGNILACYRLK